MAEEIKTNVSNVSKEVPDNGKLEGAVPGLPKEVKLVITLHPEGTLSVDAPGNGQMYDEMLCDFLMKKASRYIEAHNMRMAQPQIQRPQGSFIQRVRHFLH